MTVAEAARLLLVSQTHVRVLIRRGEIRATQAVRKAPYVVDEESVRAWKAGSTAAERKKKLGEKWRYGMVLNHHRQWRCSGCNHVNNTKDHPKCCRNCREERRSKAN